MWVWGNDVRGWTPIDQTTFDQLEAAFQALPGGDNTDTRVALRVDQGHRTANDEVNLTKVRQTNTGIGFRRAVRRFQRGGPAHTDVIVGDGRRRRVLALRRGRLGVAHARAGQGLAHRALLDGQVCVRLFLVLSGLVVRFRLSDGWRDALNTQTHEQQNSKTQYEASLLPPGHNNGNGNGNGGSNGGPQLMTQRNIGTG